MKIDMDKTYFQQDSTMFYTSNASMRENESYFGNQLISKNLWPTRSPDLTPPDFFLWGLLKGCVYSSKRRIIDTLKDMIRLEGAAITDVTLPDVFTNLHSHTKVLGCLRGPVSAYTLGRPYFASYEASTC
jgi:hypothetical protein